MHQINQCFTMSFDYPVCFTRGALATDNLTLRDILARAGNFPHKVQPVIDAEVLHHHPELIQQLEAYGRAHSSVMQLVMPPLIVRGGEICKNDPTEVEEFYRLTQERSICRHSFALVIGGGSVIDAIGYAAAVTHRGIRLIRMPTTVLAQNDAGIGVKNAINYHNRKNYLGTFAPPFAVLNDFDFLRSLPKEDQRAGMAEAVKVGLIRDGEFFEWLHAQRQVLAAFNDDAVEYMITRCAELHLQHISTSGDPFEQGSARPLDFGHWAAHRLEELSHSALRHGEAVAIGIALDSYYSHAMGMIDDSTLERIIATLRDIGFTLYHPALEQLDIYRALEDFREHLGGRLCITLLTAAGSAREVDEIQLDVMQDCVNQLRKYRAVCSGGLTYCTNIHPGESWADVMENLNAHVPAVKNACSPDKPFPLGLRISHQAAMEIGTEELNDFKQWCSEHDCYLLTVNGFPYGAFHGEVVKEQVYQPDWRTRDRVTYTKRLADLAVAMMTQPTELSISTVPIAFKPDFQAADWPLVRANLIDVLTHLAQIQQQSGVTVRLALEPEPGCVLEVIDEVLDFFARMDFPAELRKFIGLCFDACHQAVEFEDPAACLAALANADIPVFKVQVSSALHATGEEVQRLVNFDEPVYLHQAVALEDGSGKLARFNDLSELDTYLRAGHTPRECRVHFHVPIFIDHLGDCGTTRFFLEDLLPRLDPRIPLEVETYSFGVLPEHLRRDSTHASIVRELNWVTAQLNADNKGA